MKGESERVLIVGLGESGRAAARFFLARGASVAATDRRTPEELGDAAAEMKKIGVELHLGSHPPALFEQQDLIVPSPGVPWNLPELERARSAGVRTAGEVEIAASELKGFSIGVTGTNGKTTVTSLIAHILETAGRPVRAIGNIGTPLLAAVEGSRDEDCNVIELSSFQLEAMNRFRCAVAVVLNVTPDHLDRHGDLARYAEVKARILDPQTSDDAAVLNADDEICKSLSSRAKGRVVWFSRRSRLARGAWVENGSIFLDGKKIAPSELPIRGSHNLENALAAVAAASLAGVDAETVVRGLATFRAVEHRLEHVRTLDGVDYYNDSKATNVDAALKAAESFSGGLWIILGGRDKGGDFAPLARLLGTRAKGALLIGEAAEKIRVAIAPTTPCVLCGDLENAVAAAHEKASAGDTVLLAPACASFDQFHNYADRGSAFKRLTEELN